MIQSQSVSESLITLIICTDLTLISSDFSDENVIIIQSHHSFGCLTRSGSKVTDFPPPLTFHLVQKQKHLKHKPTAAEGYFFGGGGGGQQNNIVKALCSIYLVCTNFTKLFFKIKYFNSKCVFK